MSKTPLEILKERELPELLSREEMLHILLEQEYGFMPPAPESISFDVQENFIPNFCAGNAPCSKITATCRVNGKDFSFPFYSAIPREGENLPFFVHINFREDVPDRYMPSEEITDNGFAVFSFCFNDVTSDNSDFTNGLAGILFENGKREPDSCGKIAMWAWAAHRVLDYAETLSGKLDLDCAAVCGHSRLGKTALLAAATDERFRFAYSNNSGCSGASLARHNTGETVADITRVFPYWFCENYLQYASNESAMPFDQHYLLACIAPRFVLVGSAEEDAWADPVSEMLSCFAASPAFEKAGVKGFVCDNRFAVAGDAFLEGNLGYQKRSGKHYFSRSDWNRLIEFINLHK